MTCGETIRRQQASGLVQAGDLAAVAFLTGPVGSGRGRLADRRLKWTETPAGASSVISGSTVGLPGGTRNPIRALQPVIVRRLRWFGMVASVVGCGPQVDATSHPRYLLLHKILRIPNSMLQALSAPESLIDRTYQQMLAAIADGTLLPGQRIRQAELADTLGVSRQPVSHALHLLKRQGLVEDYGRKGMRVVPLDPIRVMQLYQVREAVDGLAARLAAQRPPDHAELDKLETPA